VCAECEEEFESLPTATTEPQTIFLSYAHKSDRQEDYDISEELVWLIKDELDKDGHTVWIDQEGIRSGTQWRERITSAILSHNHFLSFLSKRSVREPGVCLNEIAIALGNGRQIQTLLTESESSVFQPLTISHIQWHEFQDWKAIKDGLQTGPNGENWETWFGQRMQHIRENLSDVQKIKVAGDLQRLKDILEPKSFEAEIIAKIEGFYGRRWLFEECNHWLNHSKNRLFWLKGSPGIGKSAFAAKLVHQSNSAIIGFFKCEFQGNKSPEVSASECIRTLAYQLATRLPDYRLKLLYQQLIDKEKIEKKNSDDLFTFLITEPLNVLGKIPEATRLAIVIDALDEAGRNDGTNALADLMYKHADNLPPWLGIIFTSRPEPYLEQQFNKFEATLIEGGTEKNLQDLKDYLQENLDLAIVEPTRSEIIDQVIKKSGGIFLYLKLVEKDPSLSFANPLGLPNGIDDIFMRDFKRYFPNQESYDRDVEPFLRLMAAAPGPLPALLAQEVLGWTAREISIRVTQPLGSLIQDKQGYVFFHKSISDWLQDPKRSGPFLVEQSGANELGNFLWKEFNENPQTQWLDLIKDWLATLLPQTKEWSELTSLAKLADFLENHLKFQSALVLWDQHLLIAEKQFGKQSPQWMQSLFFRSVLQGRMLQYAKAEEGLLQTKHLSETLKQEQTEFYSDVLDAIGIVIAEQAKLPEALHFFELATLAKDKNPQISPLSQAKTMNYTAIVLDAQGKFYEANDTYQTALKIYSKSSHIFSNDCATLMNNYAIVRMRIHGGLVFGKSNPFSFATEEFKFPELLLEKALNIVQSQSLKITGPDVVTILNNYGMALHNQGKMLAAKDQYEASHSLGMELFGKNHPNIATSLNNQGALSHCMNLDDQAEIFYMKAQEILRKSLGETHPHVARVLNNLGIHLHLLGELTKANACYQEALQIYMGALGSEHCDTAQIKSNLGLLSISSGEISNGVDFLKDSLRVRVKAIGVDHPQTCNAYIHLARAQIYAKDFNTSFENYLSGLKLAIKWLGIDHPASLQIKNEITQLYSINQIDESNNHFKTVYEELIQALSTPKPQTSNTSLEDEMNLIHLKAPAEEQISLPKSRSGSFMRMQHEVLDISFTHPESFKYLM
jgi:tetratricopeptide (TPR) repeat protein